MSGGRQSVLAAGVGTLILGMLFSFHRLSTPESYAGILIGSSLLYLFLAWIVFRTEPGPGQIAALLLLSVLVRASFLTSTPVGSDDVYRYMWDGKVQAAGIDPYLYPPNDPALSGLHSSVLPALVNHPDMRTLYFPFTQWVFRACYAVSGEAVWGYKAVLLLAEMLTIVALIRLAGRYGGSRKVVLLYALCPLPIIQFALDAHVDALGLPFLAWGLLLVLAGKRTAGYVLLGISMAVKPVALVFLPILVLNERGARNRLVALVAPPGIFALQFIPYLSSPHLFDALTTYTRHWVFNGPVFEVINVLVADNQRARTICSVILAASLVLLLLGRQPVRQRIAHAVLLLLLCSPVVHPWYVTWLAVLIPLVPGRAAITFAATSSLTVFTVLTYRQTGVWQQYPVAMAAEYLPVLVLFLMDLLSRPHETVAQPVH